MGLFNRNNLALKTKVNSISLFSMMSLIMIITSNAVLGSIILMFYGRQASVLRLWRQSGDLQTQLVSIHLPVLGILCVNLTFKM